MSRGRSFLVVAMMVLVLWGTGCAPKRVVQGVPQGSPAKNTSGEDPAKAEAVDKAPRVTTSGTVGSTGGESPRVDRPDTLLPEPEIIGRSGVGALPAPRPQGEPKQVYPDDLGGRAADLARKQMGKQYQWGASGPDKFDCSGLVYYVYGSLGVDLPRVSGDQASAGKHVDQKNLKPGDLVFFTLNGRGIDHVGIYLGKSKFVHAPRRYMPVRTDSLNNSWWRRKYKGARRIG